MQALGTRFSCGSYGGVSAQNTEYCKHRGGVVLSLGRGSRILWALISARILVQSELHDPTRLYKAACVVASQPADPPMPKACRQGRPALALAPRRLATLCKILPHPARSLANLRVHRGLLPMAGEVALSPGVLYMLRC